MISVRALIISHIKAYTPTPVAEFQEYVHLHGLKLADDHSSAPNKIDMLIGADYFGHIILEGLKRGPPGTPIAQKTISWIVSGPVGALPTERVAKLRGVPNADLNRTLQSFWEEEEIPSVVHLSEEDKKCSDHYEATNSRIEGQYIERLPFKSTPIDIGQSKANALNSLLRLERRLAKNPKQAKAYDDFFNEYESLGHMKVVDAAIVGEGTRMYLPHHPVVKEGSVTTRVRVVFNASAPTSNGTSLNDHMLTGPKLQNDIAKIVLCWRSDEFVYCADVEKMYRQILVDPRDRPYQCILRRSPTSGEIETYEL